VEPELALIAAGDHIRLQQCGIVPLALTMTSHCTTYLGHNVISTRSAAGPAQSKRFLALAAAAAMQQAKAMWQWQTVCSVALWSAVLGVSAVSATNPLVPSNGAWVGVSIDWTTWASVNDYVQQAEFQPTSYTISSGGAHHSASQYVVNQQS